MEEMRTRNVKFNDEKHIIAAENCMLAAKKNERVASIQDDLHEKRTLYVELTKDCPAHCKFCYSSRTDNRPMNLAYFKYLMLPYLKSGMFKSVAITGGEPLLYKDTLIDLLGWLSSTSVPMITLNTNGMLLDRPMMDTLMKFPKLKHINVSMNGINLDERAAVMGVRHKEMLFDPEYLARKCTKAQIKKITLSHVVNDTWETSKVIDVIRYTSRIGYSSLIFRHDINEENDAKFNSIFNELKSKCDMAKKCPMSDKCNCYNFIYFGIKVTARSVNVHRELANEMAYADYVWLIRDAADKAKTDPEYAKEYLKANLKGVKPGYIRNFVYHVDDNQLHAGWSPKSAVLPEIENRIFKGDAF